MASVTQKAKWRMACISLFATGIRTKLATPNFFQPLLPVDLVTSFPGLHLVHLLPFLVRQAELRCELDHQDVHIGLVEQ